MRVVICALTVYFIYLSVAVIQTLSKGGAGFQNIFFGPSGVSFRSKNIGEGPGPGPSPGSATDYKPVFRTLNFCELRGIQSAGGPKFRYILLNKNWAKNFLGIVREFRNAGPFFYLSS